MSPYGSNTIPDDPEAFAASHERSYRRAKELRDEHWLRSQREST
jgi:hypothetical protein